ncbi:ATP-dependent helicase HrpB [Aestuariibacter sp. AA17]|uniref:ATP-dependent helicase HrpB n=1 Tax=Fluctibacter corallii TaxID=2984329 RepID=A0ABT3A6P2_9ALTE|nr:ATP-dependent helicase HrpB [Aestuariibacter sp. AA17]MCV2884346.1 ATP-dependent helicase HrpB [Aestuariibacter sp. AA17]
MSLPVESIVPDLLNALPEGNVILAAPPGAGKSTYLPLALLNSDVDCTKKKIIMLQPRRVAVRSIAEYLASQLGEPVGQTVGYRIRSEQRVSDSTRLEIVTEGLLTRLIQHDPELTDIGLIIFDEFHERNVHSDFSLALSIDVQQGLREDLRLLVMSATLDIQGVQRVLPQAKVIESQGRSFPIDYQYRPYSHQHSLSTHVVKVINEAISADNGSILVFLPGVGDIEQVAEGVSQTLPANMSLHKLHGSLSKEQQKAAIMPAKAGHRKIVLATNVAETSLTIEGISVVIDSGLEKVAQFDVKRGMTQLQTQMISQASATQRAGRAGRTQAGTCIRLWSQEQQQRLIKQAIPDIQRVDAAPYLLESLAWGTELASLPLIDMPSQANYQGGMTLLERLGAIKGGKLTERGQHIAQWGCHPRLANMLCDAKERAQNNDAAYLQHAAMLVALLESNQPLLRHGASVTQQLHEMQRTPGHPVSKQMMRWCRRLNISYNKQSPILPETVNSLLAIAFPDFLAKSRGNGGFLLANGSGAYLDEAHPLAHVPWLLVADVIVGKRADARITLAEAIPQSDVDVLFVKHISTDVDYQWNKQTESIQAKSRTRIGAIELKAEALPNPNGDEMRRVWNQLLEKEGLPLLGEQPQLTTLLNTTQLATQLIDDTFTSLNTDVLMARRDEWFAPYLDNVKTLSQLQQQDWFNRVKGLLTWDEQHALAGWFPSHLRVPTGNKHKLQYHADGRVTLSVRIQEMYGLSDTPTIANGRIPISIELLSPAQRPIQTTKDLKGFWKGSYKEVQKEMKGRYPKHFWPDDPATAVATTRTKKAM